MDMEPLDGMTDKFSKANGEWEQKMDMEFGQGLMEAIMKDNGI